MRPVSAQLRLSVSKPVIVCSSSNASSLENFWVQDKRANDVAPGKPQSWVYGKACANPERISVSSTIPAHVYEAKPRNEISVTFRKHSCNHILNDIFAASTFCRSHVAPWISCIGTCSNGARAFGERAWLSGLPGHFRCHSHEQLETPSDSTGRGWDYKRGAED